MKHPRLRLADRVPMLLLVALVALGATLAPVQAGAEDRAAVAADDELHRGFVVLLSRFHEGPSRAELDAYLAGQADAVERLAEVARDTTLPRLPRQHALQALAEYPGDEARAFAADFLAETLASDDRAMQRRATDLVARLAASAPGWAAQLLVPLAAHEDFVVREFVVRGLGTLRTFPETAAQADEMLLQLALAERNPGVQAALAEVRDEVQRVEPVGVELPDPTTPPTHTP